MPQTSTQSLPSAITNTVNVAVPNVPGAPTATAQVTTPVQASVSVAGVQTGAPAESAATQSDTPPAASASTESTAAPQAFNAVQPNLSGPAEVQGVAQTPLEVAGVQVGAPVSVPIGVPVEQNDDTVTVTGPAVVMVGNELAEVPAGEVLVLGVQALQIAPNTGLGGLVANDYVYRVQPGNTLDSIAADYYGNASYAWSIYQANKDSIGESKALTPGMVLRLP